MGLRFVSIFCGFWVGVLFTLTYGIYSYYATPPGNALTLIETYWMIIYVGSWNRLPHMTSTNSGVSNIYSQTSEATSYLSSISPADLEQLDIENQEMVIHNNQDMVKKNSLSLSNYNSKWNCPNYAQSVYFEKFFLSFSPIFQASSKKLLQDHLN